MLLLRVDTSRRGLEMVFLVMIVVAEEETEVMMSPKLFYLGGRDNPMAREYAGRLT